MGGGPDVPQDFPARHQISPYNPANPRLWSSCLSSFTRDLLHPDALCSIVPHLIEHLGIDNPATQRAIWDELKGELKLRESLKGRVSSVGGGPSEASIGIESSSIDQTYPPQPPPYSPTKAPANNQELMRGIQQYVLQCLNFPNACMHNQAARFMMLLGAGTIINKIDAFISHCWPPSIDSSRPPSSMSYVNREFVENAKKGFKQQKANSSLPSQDNLLNRGFPPTAGYFQNNFQWPQVAFSQIFAAVLTGAAFFVVLKTVAEIAKSYLNISSVIPSWLTGTNGGSKSNLHLHVDFKPNNHFNPSISQEVNSPSSSKVEPLDKDLKSRPKKSGAPNPTS